MCLGFFWEEGGVEVFCLVWVFVVVLYRAFKIFFNAFGVSGGWWGLVFILFIFFFFGVCVCVF